MVLKWISTNVIWIFCAFYMSVSSWNKFWFVTDLPKYFKRKKFGGQISHNSCSHARISVAWTVQCFTGTGWALLVQAVRAQRYEVELWEVSKWKREPQQQRHLTYFNLSACLNLPHWMRWHYWDLYTPFSLSLPMYSNLQVRGWVWSLAVNWDAT